MKHKDEYIKLKGNEHLIGKRARFKNNLKTYCRGLWLKEGVIKQLYQIEKGDLNHIGLSLVFDEPYKSGLGNSCIMKSCYIAPDSIELI
jgi:hypothetical protein